MKRLGILHDTNETHTYTWTKSDLDRYTKSSIEYICSESSKHLTLMVATREVCLNKFLGLKNVLNLSSYCIFLVLLWSTS